MQDDEGEDEGHLNRSLAKGGLRKGRMGSDKR
jgi:hypothetical protein